MVKHGQITRRQLPARILESFAKLFNIFGCLKLFECVWPFSGVGASRVNIASIDKKSLNKSMDALQKFCWQTTNNIFKNFLHSE